MRDGSSIGSGYCWVSYLAVPCICRTTNALVCSVNQHSEASAYPTQPLCPDRPACGLLAGESVRCIFTYATTRLNVPYTGRASFTFDGSNSWVSTWVGTYTSVGFTDMSVTVVRGTSTMVATAETAGTLLHLDATWMDLDAILSMST